MFFNHQELIYQIEESEFELELHKKLNSLNENESFAIICELIEHNNSIIRRFGLSILSKMKWHKNNLIAFMNKGLLLRNPSEIRYWFIAIVPQLGVNPIFELLDNYLETDPDIVQRSWYYLHIMIESKFKESTGQLQILESKFKHKYGKDICIVN